MENAGKPFEQFGVYQNTKDRIIGIVRVEKRNPDTYGKDIEQMTKLHLTFDEVDATTEMTFMPKQRLRNVKRDLFSKLESLPVMANALNGGDDGK